MKTCAYGITALELYRSSGRLLPDLLDSPRTASLAGCGILPRGMLEDILARAGALTKPYHLLVGDPSRAHRRSDVACHVRTSPLPPRSFICAGKDLLLSGPELLFAQLAAAKDCDILDLAQIGYELCGTYVLDTSWDQLTNTERPMTTVAKIRRVLDGLGAMRGVARARSALDLVRDGSNSPRETTLSLLTSSPCTEGGLGIEDIRLNYPIATPVGPRRVDVAIPRYRCGIEYKGRAYHSIEQSERDDRRQNKLVGSGYTILNVWYEDIVSDHLFQQFVCDLFRAMEVRRRVRVAGFEQKQKLLRYKLIPAFQRFEANAF